MSDQLNEFKLMYSSKYSNCALGWFALRITLM